MKTTVQTYTPQLAINNSWGIERATAILVVQRWKYNQSVTRKSTQIAAHESHRHREDEDTGRWVHLLDQHECWHRRSSQKLSHMPWFESAWPKDKTVSHKIPVRLRESVGTDIFTNINKLYHSKFSIVKQVEGFSTDTLIKTCKMFSEYRLPSKIVSDAGPNFLWEKSKNFCKQLGLCHACHHYTTIKVMDSRRIHKIYQKNYEKMSWD